MHKGEYDPSRQSPFRSHPRSSPQYVGGQSPPAFTPAVPAIPPPAGYAGARAAQYWSPGAQEPLRQSGLGVASSVIALVGGIVAVASVVAAVVWSRQTVGGGSPPPQAMAVAGFGILGGVVLNVVGAVLGLIAVMQKGRRKAFAVIGLAVNAFVLTCVVALMVIGIAAR